MGLLTSLVAAAIVGGLGYGARQLAALLRENISLENAPFDYPAFLELGGLVLYGVAGLVVVIGVLSALYHRMTGGEEEEAATEREERQEPSARESQWEEPARPQREQQRREPAMEPDPRQRPRDRRRKQQR